MKDITRNVILDLLPLYLAGEVSDDTRMLVDEYLETDPDLAEAARSSSALAETEEIPSPLKKEDKMEAYNKAKQRMWMWIIGLAFVFASIFGIALLAVIFMFFRQ